MTFGDYFEQISNIPVIIVLMCFSFGIFYGMKKKLVNFYEKFCNVTYFIYLGAKSIFYLPCFFRLIFKKRQKRNFL